jgi:hypothetical protein
MLLEIYQLREVRLARIDGHSLKRRRIVELHIRCVFPGTADKKIDAVCHLFIPSNGISLL